MSDIALQVEGVGKQFRIGKQERYRTLRDTIVDTFSAPIKRATGLLRGNHSAASNLTETIWALRDVSFEVKKGEVVGIIGRNGAGKSTLLKILSRITRPTEGQVNLYGRVGALLEVGTGFHPELTGRENVYLNGAILGMSREEIKRKFDEIVAFAEVEKFIDTPVKHYSSGMGLRLGFAVAAHLEPEILIVDEVLAVGDAQFQKKCLGKMSEVAGDGRTVLFVSHNMAAVRQLCSTSIILEGGKLHSHGETWEMVKLYQSSSSMQSSRYVSNQKNSSPAYIVEIGVYDIYNQNISVVDQSEFKICVLYNLIDYISNIYLALAIINDSGNVVLWSCDTNNRDDLSTKRSPGRHTATITIPESLLPSGSYVCSVVIYDPITHKTFDYKDSLIQFEVVEPPSLLTLLGIKNPATVNVDLLWRTFSE